MKLYIEQLSKHLSGDLAPLYLVSGDEPLQMQESVDAIRRAARQQGYSGREILEHGRDFSWSSLRSAADSLSLFAEKRLLELRLPSAKPGKDGAQALCDYASKPAADTILLVEAGKLDKSSQNTKWFKALNQQGVVLQVWPIKAANMPAWLMRRLTARGLKAEPSGVQLLCDRVEGNLLAAAQEVEKLALLYGNASGEKQVMISTEQIANAVSDSSRFNIYDLSEAALMGYTAKSIKILHGLQSEGVASTLVLWVLSSEIRTQLQFAQKIAQGQSMQQVMASVWESRKTMVAAALKRVPASLWQRLLQQCAEVDQVIKGLRKGSAWQELSQLVLMLCDERLSLKADLR